MALVARYHRRGTPKKTHEEYARLRPPLRRTVRLLASILRLAESLDRSHAQVVSALELQDRGKDVLLELRDVRRRRARSLGRAATRRAVRRADGEAHPPRPAAARQG